MLNNFANKKDTYWLRHFLKGIEGKLPDEKVRMLKYQLKKLIREEQRKIQNANSRITPSFFDNK